MSATISHNPRCGTSRTVLEMIRERGIEPKVVEYLKTPVSHHELAALIHDAGLSVCDALRTKEPLYLELGLDDAAVADEVLLDAMLANPILINRPFVRTAKGARPRRPAQLVSDLLP
jgi:arsenate reductase (glutaredoxin)